MVDTSTDILLVPIKVDTHVRATNQNYLFPSSVEPSDAPLDPYAVQGSRFKRWVNEVGATAYLGQVVRIIVRGRKSEPVVINEIGLRVLDRDTDPLTGWVNFSECGGRTPVRELKADLSDPAPEIQLFRKGVPVAQGAFRVSSTDVEVFDLKVKAAPGIVTWVVEIDYSSKGRDGTATFRSPDGRPFRLAGGGNPRAFNLFKGPRKESPTTAQRSREVERMLSNGRLDEPCW